MYIGIILSKKKYKSISYTLLIGLALLGLVIQYLEAELFFTLFDYQKYTHQFLIGTILTAVLLFLISSKLDLKDNTLSSWGREYSLFIYLYHPIVYYVSWNVLGKIAPNYYDYILALSPVFGFVITLSLAIVLNKFFPKIYNVLNGRFLINKRDSIS
jgi:peptidoglycan/LPS O-acetylase OafA/YrhL